MQEQPCIASRDHVAPDGGWGWVVLFASFCSSVIVDGTCFSFGIFYTEFLIEFGEDKGKTAWVGSVLNGMYMIMGECREMVSDNPYILSVCDASGNDKNPPFELDLV